MASAKARRGGDSGPVFRNGDHRNDGRASWDHRRADPVSSLKDQATQIAQDLVLEQLQIGAYQQKYDIDTVKVQRDAAEIRSNKDQIRADIGRVNIRSQAASSLKQFPHTSIWATEVRGTDALFDDEKKAPTVAEYEEVASG